MPDDIEAADGAQAAEASAGSDVVVDKDDDDDDSELAAVACEPINDAAARLMAAVGAGESEPPLGSL